MKEFFSENTPKIVIFLALLQAIYSFVGLQLDKEIDEGCLLLFFVLIITMLYIFFEAMLKKQGVECSLVSTVFTFKGYNIHYDNREINS